MTSSDTLQSVNVGERPNVSRKVSITFIEDVCPLKVVG